MAKITCGTCANEQDKKCLVKKSSVSINKRRNCNEYVLETFKVKEKQIIKSIKLGYREREALRLEYKKQLKLAKQATAPMDAKHPLTGDLSRFTSTVDEGDN